MTEDDRISLPGSLRTTLKVIGWIVLGVAALIVLAGGLCIAIVEFA